MCNRPIHEDTNEREKRMERYVVGRVSEVPPGARKIVEVAGRSIGVFNVNGQYFALRNRCPHQAAPLCLGAVKGSDHAVVPV